MSNAAMPKLGVLSFTAGDDSKEAAESGGWLDDSCIHHSSI